MVDANRDYITSFSKRKLSFYTNFNLRRTRWDAFSGIHFLVPVNTL